MRPSANHQVRSHQALPKKEIRCVGFKQTISAKKLKEVNEMLKSEPLSENNLKTTEIVVYPKG